MKSIIKISLYFSKNEHPNTVLYVSFTLLFPSVKHSRNLQVTKKGKVVFEVFWENERQRPHSHFLFLSIHMCLLSYHYGYYSFNTPYLKVIIHMYKENIIESSNTSHIHQDPRTSLNTCLLDSWQLVQPLKIALCPTGIAVDVCNPSIRSWHKSISNRLRPDWAGETDPIS